MEDYLELEAATIRVPPVVNQVRPAVDLEAHKLVKARFWAWLSGESPQKGSGCSLFAEQ